MAANDVSAIEKGSPLSAHESLADETGTLSDAKFETRYKTLVSHDPTLNDDPSALAAFLQHRGSIKPSWTLRMRATHPVQHTSTRMTRDGLETKTEWSTWVDFDFTIDLREDLLDEPVFWTVDNLVPTYRGGMVLEAEVEGVRRKAENGNSDEDWKVGKHGTSPGLAPWSTSKYALPSATTTASDPNPLASSRTLQDWCKSYTSSPATFKDLTFPTTTYGWNTLALRNAVYNLLLSMGYSTNREPSYHLRVELKSSPHSIRVRSPSFFNKMFFFKGYIFLAWLALIYPLLWLWRRFVPGAGARWEVMGSAFPTNRWVLLKDTHPTETLEEARSRLITTSTQEYPWVTHETKWLSRMRLGPGGVWVWAGLREGDWYRKWEGAIRNATTGQYQGPLKADYRHDTVGAHVGGEWIEKVGVGLDGYG